MIGKLISHYQILEKLGEGGMGVVYKAEDTRLKRTVALKFLPPGLTRDAQAKQRFTKEAQAASALQHNSICTVHDVDETIDGRMFIVMDCYEGKTVSQKIEEGPLPVEDGVNIAIQVGRGLAEAHRHEIVHRDVKSANVLITHAGDPKILDFGIAALAGETRATTAGVDFGTAAYMSPEQLKGEPVDHRSDIWALGVVLHEMLTGSLPFSSKFQPGLVYAILHEEPVPVNSANTAVPDDVTVVVQKALAKKVEARYQRMSEMVADLEAVIGKGGLQGSGS